MKNDENTSEITSWTSREMVTYHGKGRYFAAGVEQYLSG